MWKSSRAQPRRARSPGIGPSGRSVPSANIWCMLHAEAWMYPVLRQEGPSPSPPCSLSQGLGLSSYCLSCLLTAS